VSACVCVCVCVQEKMKLAEQRAESRELGCSMMKSFTQVQGVQGSGGNDDRKKVQGKVRAHESFFSNLRIFPSCP
jgi:hypothetical protein